MTRMTHHHTTYTRDTTAASKDSTGAAAASAAAVTPNTNSPLPPRVLQQTFEHLATKSPGALPPKQMRPVRKSEGSAWAPKPEAAVSGWMDGWIGRDGVFEFD